MLGLKSYLSGAVAVVVVVGLSGASAQERPQGYLAPDEFDVTQILEPPPRPGDPRYRTDREIFRATRKLKGSARWARHTGCRVRRARAHAGFQLRGRRELVAREGS